MVSCDVKPNTFVYTAVLNACAYTVGDQAEKAEALRIAEKTFEEMSNSQYEGVRPNHVSFASYLTACRNLLPGDDARAAAISRIFQQCRDKGQVDEIVLRRVQSSLTARQLEDLGLGGEEGTLPEKWSANVIDTRKRRKQGASPRR